jgi:hypothetical protein
LVEKIDQRGLHCSAADDSRLTERSQAQEKKREEHWTVGSSTGANGYERIARPGGADGSGTRRSVVAERGKVASAKLRVSQRADKASNMDGNWLIPALAIIAVIIGIIILVDSDDTPNSP